MNQKPKKLNYNMKNQTSPQPETHTPKKTQTGGQWKDKHNQKSEYDKEKYFGILLGLKNKKNFREERNSNDEICGRFFQEGYYRKEYIMKKS